MQMFLAESPLRKWYSWHCHFLWVKALNTSGSKIWQHSGWLTTNIKFSILATGLLKDTILICKHIHIINININLINSLVLVVHGRRALTSTCPCAIWHYISLKATVYCMISRDTEKKHFCFSFTGQYGLDGMSWIFGMFKNNRMAAWFLVVFFSILNVVKI